MLFVFSLLLFVFVFCVRCCLSVVLCTCSCSCAVLLSFDRVRSSVCLFLARVTVLCYVFVVLSLLLVSALVRENRICYCSLLFARVVALCQCASFLFAVRVLVIRVLLLSAVCARCSMLLSCVIALVRCYVVLLFVRKCIRVMCSCHVSVFAVSVLRH